MERKGYSSIQGLQPVSTETTTTTALGAGYGQLSRPPIQLERPEHSRADAGLQQSADDYADTATGEMPKQLPPVTGELVLGIDAAWTAHHPSGVALVQQLNGTWRCLAVAPSYAGFLALAAGGSLDWSQKPQAGEASMDALLAAAARLGGRPVDLIAVDMPLATEPISARRAADREVSRLFGSRGCAVHSPTKERPGRLASDLRNALAARGYRLQTADDPAGPGGLIEVYPHVALLALMTLKFRLPYKVSRSSQYWRDERPPISTRIQRLLKAYAEISDALSKEIAAIPLTLPAAEQVRSLAALKPLEDSLDALICAWVGIEHLHGRTLGLGDSTAAIWCPAAAFKSAGRS